MSAEYDPKDMIFRRLGASGLKVPIISLGGWLTYGGTVNGDPVKEILQTAYEAGINYFDTAESYSNGQSEVEMGRVFKELGIRRSDLIISTKIWGGVGRKGPNDTGLSRKHIIEGTQQSLERLQMEYVDIVFAHRPDESVPMVEIVRAFSYVIDKGQAFYWGTSEWSAAQIEEAFHVADKYNLHAPVAEQCVFNALARHRLDKELVHVFERYNYGTTTYSPLAASLLTGKYNNGIPSNSRYATASSDPYIKSLGEELATPEGKAKIEKVKALEKIAKEEFKDATTAQLAIAWTARNPRVSSLITGASSKEQVLENLKALRLVREISDDTYKKIDEIFKSA